MATLTKIVKLTATGATNTATNPGNALSDDGVIAGVAVIQRLSRTTGDHDGSNLGTITGVTLSAEITAGTFIAGAQKLELWWNSVMLIDANITGTGIWQISATGLHTYTWAELSGDIKLEARVRCANPSSQMDVDYLWYEVVYEPTTWVTVVDETVNATETAAGFVHVVVNEVINLVEDIPAQIRVAYSEGVSIVESLHVQMHVVLSEVANALDSILAYMFVRVNEVVDVVEDIVKVDKIFAIVNDMVNVVENFVRARFSFVPRLRANASTFLRRKTEAQQSRRTNRWPVKTVPKEQAAHIDEKTIVHIDHMFKNMFEYNRALRAGTIQPKDALKKEDD